MNVIIDATKEYLGLTEDMKNTYLETAAPGDWVFTIDELAKTLYKGNAYKANAAAMRSIARTQKRPDKVIIIVPNTDSNSWDYWNSPKGMADAWRTKVENVIFAIPPEFEYEGEKRIAWQFINSREEFPEEYSGTVRDAEKRHLAAILADAIGWSAYSRIEQGDDYNTTINYSKNYYNRSVMHYEHFKVRYFDEYEKYKEARDNQEFKHGEMIVARYKNNYNLYRAKTKTLLDLKDYEEKEYTFMKSLGNCTKPKASGDIYKLDCLGTKRTIREGDKTLNTSASKYRKSKKLMTEEEVDQIIAQYEWLVANDMWTEDYLEPEYKICPECGLPYKLRTDSKSKDFLNTYDDYIDEDGYHSITICPHCEAEIETEDISYERFWDDSYVGNETEADFWEDDVYIESIDEEIEY